MNIEYDKDNKERVPFEHYKEEYVKKDPLEISQRTGFPYSEEKKCFSVVSVSYTHLTLPTNSLV